MSTPVYRFEDRIKDYRQIKAGDQLVVFASGEVLQYPSLDGELYLGPCTVERLAHDGFEIHYAKDRVEVMTTLADAFIILPDHYAPTGHTDPSNMRPEVEARLHRRHRLVFNPALGKSEFKPAYHRAAE